MNIISRVLRYLKEEPFVWIFLIIFFVMLFLFFQFAPDFKEKESIIQEQESKIEDLERRISRLEILRAEEELASVEKSDDTQVSVEYSEATQVWYNLKSEGLNDYVCAGILGNIMSEVGGQTLDISQWKTLSNNGYYGICQWSGKRKDRLLKKFGNSLESQIEFLKVEMFEVIPIEDPFWSLQNEKEAALYFAKYYEKCNSKYYSVRQKNATKALEYFC